MGRQLYEKSLDENKKLSEKLTTLNEDLSKKNKEELVFSDMNTINEIKSELSDSIVKKADIYITADCESFSENGNDSSVDVTETNGKYCEEESDLDKTDQDDLLTSSTDSLEDDFKDDTQDVDVVANRFNIDKVLSQDITISEASDPGKLVEETTRLRNLVEEINRSKIKTEYELVNLRINLEEAKNENSTVLQELENTRNKLSDAEKLILSQDKLVKDLEEKIQENSFSHQRSTSSRPQSATDSESIDDTSAISEQRNKQISDSLLEEDVAKLSHECKSLQKLVQDLEETNATLRSDCSKKEELLLASHQTINEMKDDRTIALSKSPEGSRVQDTSEDISDLESSLKEAQVKIDGLLEVQEKLVSIQAEKDRLEGDVSRLEEELSIISVASRTLTACTVIPIIVLLIAIVMAFLPFISSIFGPEIFNMPLFIEIYL